MKVASVESRAVRIPREPSPAVAGADTMDFVVLTVRTDDGIEGIGYAAFQSPVLTPALKAVVDGLGEVIVGRDPMNTEGIGELLFRLGGGSPAGLLTRAISAIETAPPGPLTSPSATVTSSASHCIRWAPITAIRLASS